MKLSERIKELSSQGTVVERTVSIDIGNGKEASSLRTVRDAIFATKPDERLALVLELFRLWNGAGQFWGDAFPGDPWIPEQLALKAEATAVFGDLYKKYGGTQRIAYTLTENGQEFRVWYGLPGCLTTTHADSNGKGVLFSITGHPQLVSKYLKAFLMECTLTEIVLENGSMLYISTR